MPSSFGAMWSTGSFRSMFFASATLLLLAKLAVSASVLAFSRSRSFTA